jgi:hypothetical protein
MKKYILTYILCYFLLNLNAQLNLDSIKIHQKNSIYLAFGSASTYAASMTLLYKTWYEPYSNGKFHFFNDLNEWQGMDKLGHITTSLWLSQWMFQNAKLLNLSDNNAYKCAIGVPLAYMTTIEIFDGFSSGWGFSISDFAANTLGIGMFYLQQRIWNEQKFTLKLSWKNNQLAQYRPELLGNSFSEQALKNYNAQIYWVSFPIKDMFLKRESKFPNYINIAIGYGGNGMVGAKENIWTQNGIYNDYSNIKRFKEWRLSFDIDLRRIPLKGKAWKFFTSTFAWLKIPFPSISFSNEQKFKFHSFN